MQALTRGQRLSLGTPTFARPFRVTLSFDTAGVVVDVSCFALDAGGRLPDDRYVIFYNQPNSPEGAICLLGDTGAYQVDLGRLGPHIERLVFAATVDGDGTMRDVRTSEAVLGGELRFSVGAADAGTGKALRLVEIYRKADGWRVVATGEGFPGNLAALLAQFGGAVVEPEDAGAEDEAEEDARPLGLLQADGGGLRIDLSGAPGRDGADGRDGRDGKPGARLKKGGRSRGGNGTDGTSGRPGAKGRRGRSGAFVVARRAREVRLTGPGVATSVYGSVSIDASGGSGGRGGDGGRGGSGGSGDPSGSRGSTGAGGDGADGGDGGTVSVRVEDAHLLALFTIDVSGGDGGSGGSGSPSGRPGRSGAAGDVRLVSVDPRVGHEEEDARFGLVVTRIEFAPDASWLGGNLTRGSQLTVTGVTFRNAAAISVPAPFELAFSADSPFQLLADGAPNPHVSVPASGVSRVSCSVGVRVRGTCDVGCFHIRAAAVSRTTGLALVLNADKEDGMLGIPVNHRLDRTLSADPIDARELVSLADALDPLSPEEQVAAYTAYALLPVCVGDLLPRERLDALERSLAGRLFDAGRFRPRWSAGGSTPTATAAAHSFFRALPSETRIKLMDAALFIVTTDGRITTAEKAELRALAGGIGLGDEWLAERMPKVLAPGESSGRATRSNRRSAIVTVLCAALLAGAVLPAVQAHPSLVSAAATAPVAVSAGIVLAASGLVLATTRRLLFRAACGSCGGLNLAEISRGARRRASLIGDADEWRCEDCGARAGGEEADLAHADCAVGPPPTVLHGALPALAAALFAASWLGTGGWLPQVPWAVVVPGLLALGAVAWLPTARRATGAAALLLVLGLLVLAVTFLVHG